MILRTTSVVDLWKSLFHILVQIFDLFWAIKTMSICIYDYYTWEVFATMILFVLLQNIPGVLEFFALVIEWEKIRRNRQIANNSFIELTQLTQNFLNLVIHWLELANFIITWLRISTEKRILFKPHLILRFLRGFR